jgi:hypothetical protein
MRLSKLLASSAIALALLSGNLEAAGVTSQTKTVCNTLKVTTGSAYATNQVVGGVQTFSGLFNPNSNSGLLQGVSVTVLDNETGGFTFLPFISAPSIASTLNDNALAAIAAADVPLVRGAIPLSSNVQLGATGFSVYYGYGLGFPIVSNSVNLSGVLVANAALSTNFAGASDVQVCVTVLPDF